METWYSDDNITILFNHKPSVHIRYALPSDSKNVKENIKKYPFINIRTLDVIIKYKRDIYKFTIPKGYKWNGADIPRIIWSIIGISRTSTEVMIASLIHDVLCENHNYINSNRRLSSMIFKSLLLTAGVNKIKAGIMSECVDMFQRTQKW